MAVLECVANAERTLPTMMIFITLSKSPSSDIVDNYGVTEEEGR
jgi:hypothetical protein